MIVQTFARNGQNQSALVMSQFDYGKLAIKDWSRKTVEQAFRPAYSLLVVGLALASEVPQRLKPYGNTTLMQR